MPISSSLPSSPISNTPLAYAVNDAASSAPIDLYRVRTLFADPSLVRESEFLRREISTRMHERLALVKILPKRVLDAGCGDGPDIYTLQQRFAEARILGMDGSFGMLSAAQAQQEAAQSSVNRLLKKWLPIKSSSLESDLLCGDFAALPLARDVVDLVWSNLALHWHPQPDRVFAEWRRVLRVDGLLMFSCFGPDTFKELRGAFVTANHVSHMPLLPFVDMHDFGDMLVNVGFSTPVMDMETITVTYNTVEKLLADVKSFGGNPLATRSRSLVGRAAWQRVVDAIEATRRADGKLPLTFEIIYGHAFRPAPKKTASGESVVRWDLDKKR